MATRPSIKLDYDVLVQADADGPGIDSVEVYWGTALILVNSPPAASRHVDASNLHAAQAFGTAPVSGWYHMYIIVKFYGCSYAPQFDGYCHIEWPGDQYTCPVHPNEHSQSPGVCQICGRELQPDNPPSGGGNTHGEVSYGPPGLQGSGSGGTLLSPPTTSENGGWWGWLMGLLTPNAVAATNFAILRGNLANMGPMAERARAEAALFSTGVGLPEAGPAAAILPTGGVNTWIYYVYPHQLEMPSGVDAPPGSAYYAGTSSTSIWASVRTVLMYGVYCVFGLGFWSFLSKVGQLL
jgi:hypothetical protein